MIDRQKSRSSLARLLPAIGLALVGLAPGPDRRDAPIIDRTLVRHLGRDAYPATTSAPISRPEPERVPQRARVNYYPGLRPGQHPNASNVVHRCVPGRGAMIAGR